MDMHSIMTTELTMATSVLGNLGLGVFDIAMEDHSHSANEEERKSWRCTGYEYGHFVGLHPLNSHVWKKGLIHHHSAAISAFVKCSQIPALLSGDFTCEYIKLWVQRRC